jgi:glycosyltransferase involved in cell wall biosynthesis
LIYVGRLAPEKNVGFLLSAFSRAVRSAGSSQLTLTLVGVGPSEPALRSECSRLGIEHLVEFKGYCPQKDLPQLYYAADFFILPSVREPWGLVALEAMLCGLPVLISTQCGCAADVVTPETGWTFSPWNEDKLVELLCTLPKLPIERVREMGDAAQQLASQYSASACARRVIEAISEIPSQGEPRPVTYAG